MPLFWKSYRFAAATFDLEPGNISAINVSKHIKLL